jgi:TrmH family RNA methyltransferase
LYETLGTHSPILAAARALLTSKGRREQGAYAIEGPTLLDEARRSGLAPQAVFGTAAALGEAAGLLDGLMCPIYSLAPEAVRKLSDLTTPPGLVAVVPTRPAGLAQALEGAPAVLLADLSDPGNAGTLLRAAEIFGFRSAIFTPHAVEPWNPKVVRSAMGAFFRMRICVAPAAEAARDARAAGYRLIATGEGGTPLPRFRFPDRPLIAIGNERRGVKQALEGWDDLVTIPQSGAGESLNAGVAGSIVFYEFSRSKNEALSSLGGP